MHIDTAVFEQNIAYLQINHTPLFQKLLAYERACENGYYQKRYELICSQDGFDVTHNGITLYNEHANSYANSVANSVNFTKNENLFITFKCPILEENNPSQRDTYELLSYIKTHMPQTELFEKIEKFIFFGAGLGGHILRVDAKIRAAHYLIIEDDLELFYLSLFVTPYFELSTRSKLHFAIFEDEEEFALTAQRFINEAFYKNHYIKYFQMLSHGEAKLKAFHMRIISQSHNIFFYKSILEQYLTPLTYAKEGMKFLNMLTPYPVFSELPTLLLGAGPSLHKQLAWVGSALGHFCIVALSSTLQTLCAHNIHPDIVVHMDGFESSAAHFTQLPSFDFLRHTLYFCSARTPRTIIDFLPKEQIYLYENGTSYKEGVGNLTAPCVGSTAFLLLVAGLKVSNLYLLGLDLALDANSGATHAAGHAYGTSLDLQSAMEHTDLLEFKKSVVTVEGNFGTNAYTTPEWLLSIESLCTTAQEYKTKQQQIFNLSDGAKFQNTTPMHTQDIVLKENELLDKEALFYTLKAAFDATASSELSTHEKETILLRATKADALTKHIHMQMQIDFQSSEAFLSSLSKLLQSLTDDTSQTGANLSLILQEYFKYTLTYIFDFFNTQNIDTKTLHANALNTRLCEALLTITSIYANTIKNEQTVIKK